MTEQLPPVRLHLWVPYLCASPGEAEMCSLCGEFRTPENGGGDCPETFMDEEPELLPADIPPEPERDGADDELQLGVYPAMTADAAGVKEPVVIIAFDRGELADWRAAELPALVETILNYKRAHGYSESVCDAYRPGLTTALGTWWDEHYTCTETMTEAGRLPP